MFVLKSTHEKVRIENLVLSCKLFDLANKWGALVDRINAKGGEQFLKEAKLAPPAQLNNDEIKNLLFLCHPDKHGGSQKAEEMTKRLLEMRR